MLNFALQQWLYFRRAVWKVERQGRPRLVHWTQKWSCWVVPW